MKQFLLRRLSRVSLLLLAAVLVLWWRGQYITAENSFHWATADGYVYGVGSYNGTLYIERQHKQLAVNDPGVRLEWFPSPFAVPGDCLNRYPIASHKWMHFGVGSVTDNDQVPYETDGHPTIRSDSLPSTFSYGPKHQVTLIIADWLAALLLLVLPAMHGISLLRTLRRRRTQRDGKCGDCGYDLRATPDQCPECGGAVQVGNHRS